MEKSVSIYKVTHFKLYNVHYPLPVTQQVIQAARKVYPTNKAKDGQLYSVSIYKEVKVEYDETY